MSIEGCYVVVSDPKADERGSFFRTYCVDELRRAEIDLPVVQTSISVTARRGTIRGIHLQLPPSSERKMVRCLAGVIWDVVVDLRPGSPSWAKWSAVYLDDPVKAVVVDEGCGHGFQSLSDGCVVEYQISERYDPGRASGVSWCDPALAIDWPEPVTAMSESDRTQPTLDGLGALQGEIGRAE